MKKKIYKAVSLFLVISVLISSLSICASALSWDGSSTGGGGKTDAATVNGYAIRTSGDNVVAYRFSVVSSSGTTKNGIVIDVFRNTSSGNSCYTNEYKFTTKYNKKQLKTYQNSGYSTSKNTTNCYKETEMGFATTLPTSSGVGTWQANNTNLNKVLAKLSAGTVSTLAYGDMVLIEPLFDVKIEGIYHALTATEIAIYGKHLLGANSDGGASKNSGSWGFISNYSNMHYPNSLYTPNGQGLWDAASSLTSKATFYNIINKGYGVGIAYQQRNNATYKISFKGNGSTSGSMADLSMTVGTAKNLTNNSYSKTGNSFKNWNTKSDGTGTSYTNGQSVNNLSTTNGATVNLYAQWSPNTLEVYYHANGGSINSSTYKLSSSIVHNGSNKLVDKWTYDNARKNGLYNASTFGLYKTGYLFNQWGTSASGGTIFDQDDETVKPSQINGDIKSKNCSKTLYAQWKPITYNIAFNSNGGTGLMSNLSMTYDTAKNLTDNAFTRSGYSFAGWNSKADGTGTGYYNKQSVKNLTSTNGATVTLYAQWVVNSYTIAFNGNGATDGVTSTMQMNFDESKQLNANGYTRTGYIFNGWNTKADGTGTAYKDKQFVSNLATSGGQTVYLYAQWTPITYKIAFDNNGGVGIMPTMIMSYGAAKNLIENTFSKEGYQFKCWNTKADGTGTDYTDKQIVKNLTSTKGDTVTLFAQWIPNTYYVNFVGNGGTGSMANQVFTYDEEQSLLENAFTKAHYTFNDWNTSIDGTGTSYSDKQVVKNLTAVNNATVNLYAMWKYEPDLIVEKCDVYKDNISEANKLGTSKNSTFSSYIYQNGYPMLNDTLCYSITFPAEKVDTKVKQTVWIENGDTVSRTVMSNSNTVYTVQLNPKTVSKTDSCFYVKARADWVSDNGTILKYGVVRTFYIPVRPTVHRRSVMLKDITGNTAFIATVNSASSKVYVGQRVSATYTFSSDNEWYSKNTLTGTMCRWANNQWRAENGKADYEGEQMIAKSNSVNAQSSLGYVRVPDNSASGKSIMKFILTSAWNSDTERTKETTEINVPVVKADVAIQSIDLVYENGYLADAEHLKAGQNVKIQYTYKNNSDITVYVEGFNDDKSQISGIYSIAPHSTISVYGKSFTVPNERKFKIWGGVYLEGAGIYNAEWEKNSTNNDMTLTCCVDHPLSIIPITPNAPYREKTSVVTSFWLNNDSDINYTPSDKISVRFRVYKADGTLIQTVTKSKVVVPKNDMNLIYFKWSVPEGLSSNNIKIAADILDSGSYYSLTEKEYATTPFVINQTPDTQYEDHKPTTFTMPNVPTATTNYATWYEYSYNDGTYTKTKYGLGLKGTTDSIEPATGTTSFYDGKWNMKSGYGISLTAKSNLTAGVSGYTNPQAEAVTMPQYFLALYPEYSYSTDKSKSTTLVQSGTNMTLPNFKTYGNVHFTPLWYPDADYTVSVLASDCWTPAGMITVNSITNTINISGSAYDDWYVGRK